MQINSLGKQNKKLNSHYLTTANIEKRLVGLFGFIIIIIISIRYYFYESINQKSVVRYLFVHNVSTNSSIYNFSSINIISFLFLVDWY
eukprot:gene9250-6503_t